MDAIGPASALSPSTAPRTTNSFSELGSDDFFKLLITQLTNQDPLAPTGNEELLRQISSIRDIELSTTLTHSLQSLTGQQNVASASSLLGQYVTGVPGPDGVPTSGLVVGLRFAEGGRPLLLLSNGTEMALEQVSTVQPPLAAAEAFVGLTVTGVDRRKPQQPEVVEGIVTGARLDEQREAVLELDSGASLRLRDLVGVVATTTE